MKFRDWSLAVLLTTLPALVTSARAQVPASSPGPPDTTAAGNSIAAPIPAATVVSTPPDFPRGKISGLMFGDLYYNAAGDPRHGYNGAGADTVNPAYIDGSGKPIGRDLNGLQFRRIYFQLDNDLSIRFSTRFRLEADSKALSSDGKLGLYVKAAWLRARSVVPRGDLYAGMIGTPTFQSTEDFWQYRSIEKTQVDFRGLASSSDLGVGLVGYADAGHHLGYSAMIGDNSGQKPENNRDKRFYLSLPFRWSDLRIEPYVDYENQPGRKDRALYKVFAGYEFRRFAVGAEAFAQVRHAPTGTYQEPRGGSLFARATPRANLAAFGRVDYWVPDQRAASRVDQSLWIGGIDWQPLRDIHVMPNVEALQYHAKGGAVAPAHHDLQLRLTFYYLFSRPQS